MSGSTFDCGTHVISDWIDVANFEVKRLDYKGKPVYSKKTKTKIAWCIKQLKIAHVCAFGMDHLFSGDDGEDTFHANLELNDMENLIFCLFWNLIVFVSGCCLGELHYRYREDKRIRQEALDKQLREIERKLNDLDVKARYPKGHQI
jgi:hypothetical protein